MTSRREIITRRGDRVAAGSAGTAEWRDADSVVKCFTPGGLWAKLRLQRSAELANGTATPERLDSYLAASH